MKRVIYITLIAAGMITVSCSKETIRPNSTVGADAPAWKSSMTQSNDGGQTSTTDGTITDPNNDKDENTRRKN